MGSERHDNILLGRISGLFGVKGWVKVFSYTEPREHIVRYSPWRLVYLGGERCVTVACGRSHNEAVIAKLLGIDDRDRAAGLVGAEILISCEQLEPLPTGEYYWAQLLGLEIIDMQGRVLGAVEYLLRSGAHDVMVVQGDRQRLIPFVQGTIVKDIDLIAGVMCVDWAPDY
jgi:16S rRNA processing protein RimM